MSAEIPTPMSRFFSAPARKKWRWLLVVAAAGLLVGVLPPLILAQWGPYFLGRALSTSLQTSVTVQGVTGGWWSGMTIHQLTVAEDHTPQAPVLVRVDHLTINLPLVSLLLSTKPLALRLDAIRIDLRRRQDGQWNLAALLEALGTGVSAPSYIRAVVPRLNRQVAVALTQGQLRLGDEGPLYALIGSAESPSLAAAPLQWQVALTSADGASLAVRGQVDHLLETGPLVGHAAFTLEVQDMQPVIRPLTGLLPATLRLGGRLQVTGRVAGAISRANAQSWNTRLAGLSADLEGDLAWAQWGEAEITGLAVRLHWAAGGLTITQAEARIAGGVMALQGEVSLQEPTASQGLQWRLAGIRLDQILGHAFQPVTIAEAVGRLTHQGDGFVLETSVQVPTFALAPGTLGQRQPQLTRVALTCTLKLPPPFTRLAMEACRLHAAEAQLSLRDGSVDLGPDPQLTLRVDGSLAGQLVGALVPEVPGRFPDPVRVDGQIIIPFRGAVWQKMRWRLAVASPSVVVDDIFTEVQTTVVKAADQIEIAELHARRGTGWVHGAGAWRLAEPVEGGLQVELDHLPFRQSLAPEATGGPYLVEGTASGIIAWRMGLDGEQFTVDGDVHSLHLLHAAAAVVQVPGGRVQGKLERDRDDAWRGDRLVFRGDGLAAELRDVVAHRTPTHYNLSGALYLQASTEVITGLAGGLLPDRLQVSGPVELAGNAAGQIAADGSVLLRDVTYTGDLRVARVAWEDTTWEAVAARLTLAQGRLTIDEARARVLGGWMRLRPDTFVDLQEPRHDFHLHLAAEQLDLRLETGKRVPLLALVVPLFLLEADRREPMHMSGMFDAELHASGTYDGQPGWGQSVNGDGYFRLTQGAVIGSTVISGFVGKALMLPANLTDQGLKALLDREGKPLQVIESLLQRPFVFRTLDSPIRLRAGEIHLKDNLTVAAPEFSLVINGHSTVEGTVDYVVHSDLIHRLLFGELISLPERIPILGTALRHLNPFQRDHQHIELSATVQGNLFRRTAAGQPDVHVDVYFVQ